MRNTKVVGILSARTLPVTVLFAFLCLRCFGGSADSVGIRFARFGKISVYKSKGTACSVIIFAAGDRGWNRRTVSMMKSIRSPGEVYVGINTRQYLNNIEKEKNECLYAAGDFQALSDYVKRKLQIRENAPTILLGYSAGADLVYGTLCQAPPGVFKGAIVIGFCPDLAVRIPFCKGSGKFDMIPWTKKNGYNFGPCTNLAEPFISLQGMKDGVCNYQATQSFLEEVQNAKLVKLPHTGHMYFIYKRWVPYMKEELKRLKS